MVQSRSTTLPILHFEATRVPLLPILLAVDFLLAALYLADFIVGSPIKVLSGILDLNSESSLSSWYSSMQLLAVAVPLGLAGYQNLLRKNDGAYLLLILAVLLVMLSIDEHIQLHEYIGKKSDALLLHGTRTSGLFKKKRGSGCSFLDCH